MPSSPSFLSAKFAFTITLLFLLASCSLFRERTIQDVINDLPRYNDNTPIMWSLSAPEQLKSLKTIGDLKKAISNGLDPNKTVKHGDYPSDFLEWAYYSYRDINKDLDKRLKSRLAALDVLLAAGANPQRMTYSMLVTEEEYALYIKHGLSAKEPIQVCFGPTEYPLTNRLAFLSPPIVKWLLENGADPNQLEYFDDPYFSKMSPLSNLLSSPLENVDFYQLEDAAVLWELKTKRYKNKIKKILIEHGATVCTPYRRKIRFPEKPNEPD